MSRSRKHSIVWQSGSLSSCLYAARAVTLTKSSRSPFIQALGDRPRRLSQLLHLGGATADDVWRTMILLAADRQSTQDVVTAALQRAKCQLSERLGEICEEIDRLQVQARSFFPEWDRDLALRTHLLRGQWETCGLGMLHQFSRRPEFSQASGTRFPVLVVEPVVGGAGFAREDPLGCCVEGLLVNPNSQLPEILRLTWYLFQGLIAGESGIRVDDRLRVGTLPLLFELAEQVELAPFHSDAVAVAFQSWCGWDSPGMAALAGRELMAWWDSHRLRADVWTHGLATLPESSCSGPI